MTTPQTIAAGAALLVFAALLLFSRSLRIRPWVIALAGLVGFGLAIMMGLLVNRVGSFEDFVTGMALLAAGGVLLLVAVNLISRRSASAGRLYAPPGGAKMIPATREGRAPKAKPMALNEAQSREMAMLTQPSAAEQRESEPLASEAEAETGMTPPILAGPMPEEPHDESAQDKAGAVPQKDARQECAEAQPAEEPAAATMEPAAGDNQQSEDLGLDIAPEAGSKAEEEPEATQAAAEPEAEFAETAAQQESREEEIKRLDKLFREEQERLAREAEERILEEARLAREEEARKAEKHRVLKEEVRIAERERNARQEERRRKEQDRHARKEEERRLKQEKQQEAVAAEEAQLIRERIQAEKQRVAEQEAQRQQEQETAEKATEKAVEKVFAALPVEQDEDARWQSEQERLAKELEARRESQRKAAEEEAAWLEEQQRLAREAEALQTARQLAAEEAQRLQQEQERLAQEAEERRLEQERVEREAEVARLERERLEQEAEEIRKEQERLEREAEARRLEEERMAREQAEREETARREAEDSIRAGEAMAAQGRLPDALRTLEHAAKMDVQDELRARATVAIVETLLAMGWKAEAMKKLQAMKGISMDPADRKRLDAILRKAI